MKYGIFSTEQANSRSQLVKDIMCKAGPTDEERQTLKYYYYFEKYTNYGTRISILPVLFLMYKKKFFDKKSPFFLREILACLVGVTYIGGADWLASEYMWKNCYQIVKKHNNMMDSYYMDPKMAQKLKQSEFRKEERMYD